jgi:hypothetical protein
MNKNLIVIILAGILFYLTGCSTGSPTKYFIRENANLPLIRTVAVMPFEGGGRAPRIREQAMTQILATDTFDVVDKGLIDSVLLREAIAPASPLDAFTIRRLCESLKVDAVLLGSVEEITESRGNASFPEITLTLRILDCESGLLLWQASGRGSGYSLSDRLFGMAPKDTFQVTMELFDELFATIQ